MRLDFGSIFQFFSKDRTMSGLVSIHEDTEKWPLEWKKVHFKTYLQHPKINLPKPSVHLDISVAVLNRQSLKTWSQKPLSLQDFSNLLFYAAGTTRKALDPDASFRAQASAGKRYPLEIYIVNLRAGDLQRFVYHYNPETHTLDELWSLDYFNDKIIHDMLLPDWATDAGALCFITGVPERSTSKYGERGYRFMYLEAGAVAHMLHILGSNNGLASTYLGGMDDTIVEKVLDIDGEFETVLHTVIIGKA
jgi:SagB-type dehydrogenase family enzyme